MAEALLGGGMLCHYRYARGGTDARLTAAAKPQGPICVESRGSGYRKTETLLKVTGDLFHLLHNQMTGMRG